MNTPSKKPQFSSRDIEENILKHDDFTQIKGTYLLFSNSVPLQSVEEGIHFYCTKENFEDFLNYLSQLLIKLSTVSSEEVPVGWVPFPGTSRGKILSHYSNSQEGELELISTDPNIIVVKKVADSGQKVIWEPMDGRIGHGGFSTT